MAGRPIRISDEPARYFRLAARLAGAAALELAGDADECERGELLSGVAADMQDMLASGRTEGSTVCLNLLRHLAYTH
jgi:hypothetical protein